jgi:3-oxoacyl-[acyl-carrier protein] reductase
VSSELNGKVALVTGASRGLGEGAARALAASGAAVMLVARDGALAGSVARDIAAKGARAEALSCDVSDYAAVEKVVAETKARLGGIDILINNAGVIDPIAEGRHLRPGSLGAEYLDQSHRRLSCRARGAARHAGQGRRVDR